MTTQLTIADITCRYGERVVCDGLSFSVDAGDIACLLGPSGCGKTTALRAIAGFEPVHAGSITLAGRVLSSTVVDVPTEQREIGMVFQDYALFPHLTVRDNIGFGLQGLSVSERETTVQQLLALTRLQDCAEKWPQQLSGGQQQRVALARALAPRPKLLLLDEPFSNLDAELRRSLCTDVRELLKLQGTTAILVTHDQHEAFATADRIGLMMDGRILQWGSARELYEKPGSSAVARFIGQGQLLAGRLEANVLHSALGSVKLPASVLAGLGTPASAAHDVEFLLRPWNLEPASDGVQATIVDQLFLGASTTSTLQLADGTRLASQHEGFAALPCGSRVFLRLNPQRLCVFAATSP